MQERKELAPCLCAAHMSEAQAEAQRQRSVLQPFCAFPLQKGCNVKLCNIMFNALHVVNYNEW